MKLGLGFAVVLLLIGTALLSVPYFAPFFIFRPTSMISEQPQKWGLKGAAGISFGAVDHSRMYAWWIPPANDVRPVVLIVHGRSANISTRAGIARTLTAGGFGVLLFDYRGYGNSEGVPSESHINEDTLSAYNWMLGQNISPKRIVVLGQSLGDAPATWLASIRPTAGLILVSPFTSIPDAAADRLPWLPIASLPWRKNRFDVFKNLRRVLVPVTFVVSKNDGLVPMENSQKLARAHVPAVSWIEDDRFQHNGLLSGVAESGGLKKVLDAIVKNGYLQGAHNAHP